MSEKVSLALWAKWDGKLYNWALCGFAKGIQRANVKERAPRTYDEDHWTTYVDRKDGTRGHAETYDDAAPPGLTVEGLDTDALVIQLSARLLAAIEAYWAMTGPMEYRASAIGCHLSTLYRRVDAAILELERLDGERKGYRTNPVTGKPEYTLVVKRTQFVPENPDA
jgi:hypothetical protein